jgi:hypothetical protein
MENNSLAGRHTFQLSALSVGNNRAATVGCGTGISWIRNQFFLPSRWANGLNQ